MALLVVTLGAAACSGLDRDVRRAANFDARVGDSYRVAVLPFTVSASEDGALTGAIGDLGSLLALDGVEDDAPMFAKASTILRRAFTAELANSRFEVLELWISDTALRQNGYLPRGREIAVRDAQAMARLLGVDGLVLGDVTAWNRSYYGLQSNQAVGLRTRLVDRRSGDILVDAVHRANETSGLSGGPTGFVSLGTAPIEGLRGSTLAQLSRDVARAAAMDLVPEPLHADLDAEAAKGMVPSLSFFAFTTSRRGALRPGDRITVVCVGTADAEVRFDIGRYRRGVPMVATDRVDGPRGSRQTYVGYYVVQQGDRFGPLPVWITTKRGDLASRHRVLSGTVAAEST
ncbi:MAG: DUF799 family lipoprotein [Planctomycetes bacterium]|nr:DUF799 family lipoprotein [Planctomycetota bacterium]